MPTAFTWSDHHQSLFVAEHGQIVQVGLDGERHNPFDLGKRVDQIVATGAGPLGIRADDRVWLLHPDATEPISDSGYEPPPDTSSPTRRQPTRLHEIAADPAGHRIFISTIRRGRGPWALQVLDTTTGNISVPNIGGWDGSVAVHPTGRWLLDDDGDGGRHVGLRTTTSWEVLDLAIQRGPRGVAFSPDGESAYVAFGNLIATLPGNLDHMIARRLLDGVSQTIKELLKLHPVTTGQLPQENVEVITAEVTRHTDFTADLTVIYRSSLFPTVPKIGVTLQCHWEDDFHVSPAAAAEGITASLHLRHSQGEEALSEPREDVQYWPS
ncbi:MAG: hypothetical protein KDC39_08595 [Actinobacteria bacterium]|nr:hypothetical protein [Actinomycetota bacterium]